MTAVCAKPFNQGPRLNRFRKHVVWVRKGRHYVQTDVMVDVSKRPLPAPILPHR